MTNADRTGSGCSTVVEMTSIPLPQTTIQHIEIIPMFGTLRTCRTLFHSNPIRYSFRFIGQTEGKRAMATAGSLLKKDVKLALVQLASGLSALMFCPSHILHISKLFSPS